MNIRAPIIAGMAVAAALSAAPAGANMSTEQDRLTVAALDIEFQAAVKRGDFATMDRILHDDYLLVLGDGRTLNKAQLLAHERTQTYEQQDEDPGTQMVRVYGDTAVVTARLWLKGTGANGSFDLKLWFTDTYVRTPQGWRYAYAQASLPLPAGSQ